KAPADDLIETAARQRILGGALHALGVAEHPYRAAPRRQRGGQPLQAIDARDLLDQVDLARDVVAAQRWDGDLEALVDLLAGEVQAPQDLGLALAGHGHSEDRLHARLAQAQTARGRRRPRHVDRPGP